MPFNPLPSPYTKYIYSNADEFTSADPDLIKKAIGSLGYDEDASSAMFADWSRLMGVPLSGGSTSGAQSTGGGGIDFQSMINSDPFYLQAKADMSAQGVADAASRAAAIKRTLIDWGVIPDVKAAADKLGLSSTALGYFNTDVDERTRQLAAENEAQGLSMHSRLGKANTDNVRAIRNALAARGMYQSGELGYGLTENAQQYKQASTDAEKQVLGNLEEVSGRFVQSERERTRAVAEAMMAAAQRAAMMAGSMGGQTTPGMTTPTGGQTTAGAPLTGNANPGPGQIGWNEQTRTPAAGQDLPAGTYFVNGEYWQYDPTRGWTKGVASGSGAGTSSYYAPRPTRYSV